MKQLVLATLVLVFPASISAGVHPPEVEERLAFLVEDWTIAGAEGTYRETCEWYAEWSFVVCWYAPAFRWLHRALRLQSGPRR